MLSEPIERPSASADAPPATNVVPLPVAPAAPAASERLPRPALAYVLGTFIAGLLAVAYFGPRLNSGDLGGFLLLAVLAVVFGRTRIPIYGDTTVSIAAVTDVAIALLFGPAGAALASPLVTLSTNSGGVWYKRLFNVGSEVLVNVTVASVAWALMGGHLSVNIWSIPITIFAVSLYYALNIGTVTVAVSLATRTRLVDVWREKFEWLLPHYAVFGLLGLALAVAYNGMGYFGLLAFVAPPLMLRFTIKQYVDKTADNVAELNKRNRELQKANHDILGMAEQLRQTYDGTLEALVSALDARDRETKGHSLRVAKYMMEVAYHMGVPPGTEEWVDMQRGGLLHDIGKIGVSDSILHKPDKLTEEEWVDMRRHPKIGFDMLKDISFLAGAAKIVLAHHERFDGKGYPRGLAADEIPIGARIFVLADTFDAMTSDRPYRRALSVEASREEIIRCSGTQFDPRCVQAFLLAWDKIVEIRYTDHEEVTEHHAAAAPRQAA
ncbi:MAG TPA: HD-GYP domain-containing protein [Dehalococcoidia bacterium]|nr:HD-GYP domain-containing protein [Dehalococcoidia bacterium]